MNSCTRGRELTDPYIKSIKSRLSSERFRHSINVSVEARRLAKKYGADPKKAEIAGILHDVCKEITRDEHLKIFGRFGVILTDIEQKTFKLWHSISGSLYIKHMLNVTDPDIYNAVRYHTSGRAGMSILEKVVFIADFISKDRTYAEAAKIREAATISLERAMKAGLRYTIRELLSKNLPVAPESIAAYNEIVL
jgi:nicotinate-nucleotide adenylyltransferase